MESILLRMQDTAQLYVDILGDILGIDVSIVDHRQTRIAGSGRMKTRTGSIADYGNISKHAMEAKQTVIVEDPRVNPLCEGCPTREHCDNLCEIWSPILVDHEAVGVIGCVCYTQEQKDAFLERRTLFQQFFTQFAGLLENKAHDLLDIDRHQNVCKLLERVLERAQIGSLILDEQGHIYDINRLGKELLGLRQDFRQFPQVSLQPAGAGSQKEYNILCGGQSHHVIAEIYRISMPPYEQLVLFSNAQFRTDISDELLGVAPSSDLERIIGNSPPVRRLKKDIHTVSSSVSNVLITGESGTGKELIARAVHGESHRKKGPFVAVNCAALPESLLESELFGYVKGAFTGASAQGKAGLLETAQDGTFFLDEIGEMPLTLQVKLLRVLEQREVLRLGSNKPIPINARFIFATNRDLEEMVREGTFRKDFYYRINVVPLTIPPLRERREDIRVMAEAFIRRFCTSLGKPCAGVSEDFWSLLEQYDWPGNVRELQNTMEFAVNMMPSSGMLRSELLRNRIQPDGRSGALPDLVFYEDWNLSHVEEQLIRRCLEACAGQKDGKRVAAQKLGISQATLYRKLKQYHI